MSSRKSILALGCMGLTGLLLSSGHAMAAENEAPAVKTGLDARFRYESTVDKDLKKRSDFLSMRVRPSLTYTLNPKSTFFFQPQYNKVMGLGVYSPSDSIPTDSASSDPENSYTETSGNSSYPGDELRVHQAYFDIGLNDSLKFTAGRQELAYGDQYLVSGSSWNMYGRSFDAAKLRWMDGKSFIDVLHSKLATVSNTTDEDGTDKSMSAIYASWNINENFKALEVYSFYVADNRLATAPGATTASEYYGAHGLRLVTEFGQFGFKIEGAQNYGGTPSGFLDDSSDAYMSVTELSYKFEDSMASKLALEVFVAGKNWREIFGTTHATLGITDVLGRRNLTGAGLHYSADVSEKWNLLADFYMFQRTSTDNAAYATNSKTKVGDETASDSKDIGTELDLRAKYKMDQNLNFSLGLAAFKPGSFLSDGAGKDKTPSYAFVMFDTKF